MDREKNKGKLIILASVFLLLAFYYAIVLYVLFNIAHIYISKNFVCSLVFEGIGFAALLFVLLINSISKSIKTGYYIPLVISTILYSLLLSFLNLSGAFIIPDVFFFLIHMVLLFLYLLIAIPMFIMGKQ